VLLKQMKPNLTTSQALAALQVTGKQVTQGHGYVDQVNTGTGVQNIPGSGLQADGKWSRLIDVGAAVDLLSSPPQGATPDDLMTALSLWHSGGNQTPQGFEGILNIVAKHTAVVTNQAGQ
jgi:hypothetical protein